MNTADRAKSQHFVVIGASAGGIRPLQKYVPFRIPTPAASVLVILLGIALALAGCAPAGGAPTLTAMPTNTPVEPTDTPVVPTLTAVPTNTPVVPTDTPLPTPANAVIAISPTSGPPGTALQVSGQGFPPNSDLLVGAGPVESEYEVLDTARTAADGALDTSISIPSVAWPGEQWVVVAAAPDGPVWATSHIFRVTEPGAEATVEVAPRAVSPGEALQVTARGFPPGAPVEFGIGRVDSEYDVIATGATDETGAADTSLTIPDFVEPEDRWVIVVATQDHALTVISPVLEIEPDGDVALFTRTHIYVIAVGDGGQTGEEIGCGDSVVPVEIEIEPTAAPLTAALERLLALDSREYGASGLYNALYQSDLSLENVSIVDGEAIIELAGTLSLGGVCDNPRVEAQLRETALQYATVERVSISVNGMSLEDVLSESGG